jgi:dienelactone hydrolase
MSNRSLRFERLVAALLLAGVVACGGALPVRSPDAGADSDAGAEIDAGSIGDAGTNSDAGSSSDAGAGVDAGAAPDAGADAGAPADAGTQTAFDPTRPGPCALAEFDAQIVAPATGETLPLHVIYPVNCSVPAPWVPVVIAHGFILPASQYLVTARTLAAFGAVALTVDFPTSLFGAPNHVKSAEDLSAGLDWLVAQNTTASSPLHGKVGARAVMLGHSLGGKLAILAAASDSRVAAVIGFDPVDGSMNCSATACPTALSKLPLPIPILFLGETIDEAGTLGQACAPANENFQTLYAKASSPSAQVNIAGADHMDFLDDPSTCGAPCLACKAATAAHAPVIALARAEANAFIEKYLRGDASADAWIAGAKAQSAWVATGQADIAAK